MQYEIANPLKEESCHRKLNILSRDEAINTIGKRDYRQRRQLQCLLPQTITRPQRQVHTNYLNPQRRDMQNF